MKAMRVGVGLFLMACVPGLSGATAAAQQTSGPPTTAAAEVTQCAQAQMVVDQLLASAMARLDAARQSNAATDLRAAVDSQQNTMRDARAQFAACASTTPAAPMDHSKMPMGSAPAAMPATGAKPPSPAPMDHSKMPMGNPPAAKPATGAKPSAPTPMDHSKMPMGAPPAAKPGAAAKPAATVKPAAAAPMDHSKMPMGATPAAKPAAAPAGKPATSGAAMDHSKMPMGAPPAATSGGAAKPAATVKPAAAAPMDHSKMPMGATPAAKPAAAPAGKPATSGAAMDHSKMAMGQPADTTQQAVDPVCGLKVDPASAPQATHQGRAYSFCSEQHRGLFQKTPAKYLPKGK